MVDNSIASLEKEAGILLGSIQILDEYLHIKKRKDKVTTTDINDMQKMIQKFVRILAVIDAFELFRDENQMLTDENIDTFMSRAADNYSIRLKKFTNDLENLLSF